MRTLAPTFEFGGRRRRSVLNRIFGHRDTTAPDKTKTVTLSIEKHEPTHFKTSRGTVLPIGLTLFGTYKTETPNAAVTKDGIKFHGKTYYDDPPSAAPAAKLRFAASQPASSTHGRDFGNTRERALRLYRPVPQAAQQVASSSTQPLYSSWTFLIHLLEYHCKLLIINIKLIQ